MYRFKKNEYIEEEWKLFQIATESFFLYFFFFIIKEEEEEEVSQKKTPLLASPTTAHGAIGIT